MIIELRPFHLTSLGGALTIFLGVSGEARNPDPRPLSGGSTSRLLEGVWLPLIFPGYHIGDVRAKGKPETTPSLRLLSRPWVALPLLFSATNSGGVATLQLDVPHPPGFLLLLLWLRRFCYTLFATWGVVVSAVTACCSEIPPTDQLSTQRGTETSCPP